MDTSDTIKQIVAKVMKVEESKVEEDHRFTEDLKVEPLDFAEIIMLIEDTYDIEIPDEDLEKIQSIEQAVQYVEESADRKSVV